MTKSRILSVVLVLALYGSSAIADSINGINIDFVPIGYAGNAADLDPNANRSGYGAVDYDYRISTREITYAQFAASGIGNGDENFWVASLGSSNAPAARVNLGEAARYCNWLTSGSTTSGAYTISNGLVVAIDRASALSTYGTVYVLPTEDEWYKAAYFNGTNNTYSLFANVAGTQPGTNQTRYANSAPWIVGMGDMELNRTFDMMGNVFEHTETLSSNVAFRGGAYFQNAANLQATWRTTDSATGNFNNTGLRVVALIPEPGTISLMSLSTVGLFITRTSRRRRLAGRSLLPIRREENFIDAFCAEEEWQVSGAEADVEDGLSILFDLAKQSCVRGWTTAHGVYKNADKAFWNFMVSRHEQKLARRKAFRHSLRKKSLDCLDGFLARIMK